MRLIYVTLLALLVGLTACARRTIQRGPDGEITRIIWSGAVKSTCYMMTLHPALHSSMGGYSLAQPVCRVFRARMPATQPLVHLENSSTGDHLYTTRLTEISEAAQWGYAFRDTLCYVFATPGPDRVPLFRLWKEGAWCHFYTTVEAERDSMVRMHGFTAEGEACYVPQEEISGAVLLYRMQKVSE